MLRPLTLALGQFKPRKGDYAANLERLGALVAQADALSPRPDVVQFPETATTGYFVEGGVRDLAVTAGTLARDLDAAYRRAAPHGRPIDVVIGFYEVWEDTLFNSAMYVTLGERDPRYTIRHVHRKHFLPTYGLFDEERFVERGHDVRAFDTRWGRAAILICEDAWHSLTGTIAALDGAQLVFLSSAAPARGAWPRDDAIPGPASVARWERLVRDIAEEHGMFVSYVNLVGSEGGKSFSGSSCVCGPKGDMRARAPVFDEALLTITVDLGDLTRARADSPLLNDLRTALPHLLGMLDRVDRRVPARLEYDGPADDEGHGIVSADARGHAGAASNGESAGGAGTPHAATAATAATAARGAPPEHQHAATGATAHNPSRADGTPVLRIADSAHGNPPPLDIDPEMVEGWLVQFIRDELSRRGFAKAVVGLSGGVDSAVTTYLAARALGPENVVAVRMPYRTSSPESLAHAQLVVDALGVQTRTVDISNAVDGYLALEPEADPSRRGNVMARMRMIVLFDLSARHRALPLGTGNKTERLFGYFTWHADDSPPVNPLGDLYKTQVWALARHLGVPAAIVDKPASADLVQGQTDEGDFGISYARADVILNWLLHGWSPRDLVARGLPAAEVELVRRRLAGTHWKRRLPAVAMLSATAIGESYLRPVDY